MTIALSTSGAGTPAAGSTSIAVAYPAAVAAGRLAVLKVVAKPDTATIADISGWTSVASGSGGTGTQGVDTGAMAIRVFYKVLAGTESGNVTVSVTSGNSSQAVIDIYQGTWGFDTASFAGTTGADATHLTDWSATGGANLSLAAGDYLLGVSACTSNATNNLTISSRSVSATGSTFGSITNTRATTSNTGNDCTLDTWEASVSTGPSSAAPVYTGTHSANDSGITAFVKLVETVATPYIRVTQANLDTPEPPPETNISAESASFTATASAPASSDLTFPAGLGDTSVSTANAVGAVSNDAGATSSAVTASNAAVTADIVASLADAATTALDASTNLAALAEFGDVGVAAADAAVAVAPAGEAASATSSAADASTAVALGAEATSGTFIATGASTALVTDAESVESAVSASDASVSTSASVDAEISSAALSAEDATTELSSPAAIAEFVTTADDIAIDVALEAEACVSTADAQDAMADAAVSAEASDVLIAANDGTIELSAATVAAPADSALVEIATDDVATVTEIAAEAAVLAVDGETALAAVDVTSDNTVAVQALDAAVDETFGSETAEIDLLPADDAATMADIAPSAEAASTLTVVAEDITAAVGMVADAGAASISLASTGTSSGNEAQPTTASVSIDAGDVSVTSDKSPDAEAALPSLTVFDASTAVSTSAEAGAVAVTSSQVTLDVTVAAEVPQVTATAQNAEARPVIDNAPAAVSTIALAANDVTVYLSGEATAGTATVAADAQAPTVSTVINELSATPPVISVVVAGQAAHARGTSEWSDYATATTFVSDVIFPNAPYLTGSIVSGPHVSLSWTAVEGATSYDVERDAVVIASGVTETSYVDTTAPEGAWLDYRVRATR